MKLKLIIRDGYIQNVRKFYRNLEGDRRQRHDNKQRPLAVISKLLASVTACSNSVN